MSEKSQKAEVTLAVIVTEDIQGKEDEKKVILYITNPITMSVNTKILEVLSKYVNGKKNFELLLNQESQPFLLKKSIKSKSFILNMSLLEAVLSEENKSIIILTNKSTKEVFLPQKKKLGINQSVTIKNQNEILL